MKKSAETIAEEYFITEILKGTFKPDTMLQSERELAKTLEFSRPVIHKALIRVEARGLVTIIPRRGVRVNDYRLSGKLAMLESVYDLYRTGITRELNSSMLRFIRNNFLMILILASRIDPGLKMKLCATQENRQIETGLDVFLWMHTYAVACGNLVYPMLINEFKTGIINVSDVLLNEAARDSFIQRIKELDGTFGRRGEEKEIERRGIEERLQSLFDFIELTWLGRKEEDAQ